MADVNLVTDRGLAFRKKAPKGLVACPLHEPDHRGRRESAFAADVTGEQIAFDNTLQAPFEPRPDSV
jgi:hypothetical protein